MYEESNRIYEGQLRRYCFTWNNYPPDWKVCLDKLKSKFLVGGKEIAPKTGTKHIQGYFEFGGGKNFSTIIKKCPGIWLAVAKGSAEQNVTYCSKMKKVYTTGEISKQGERNDLKAAMASIKAGMSEIEMFENHTGVQVKYGKSMERYRQLCDKQKSKGFQKKNVRVYYGKTGTGKTSSAVSEFCSDYCIVSSGITGLWWTEYDGESTVIIDEFRGTIPLSQLLRMLDGYSCSVDIKGSSKMLRAKTIILTSNVNPRDWYKNADEESQKALFRRFDEIRYYYDFNTYNNESKDLI